jgi:hypothetical protein
MLSDTFAGKTSLVPRFAEGHYRDSARKTVGAFLLQSDYRLGNDMQNPNLAQQDKNT